MTAKRYDEPAAQKKAGTTRVPAEVRDVNREIHHIKHWPDMRFPGAPAVKPVLRRAVKDDVSLKMNAR
jgi:hypothetical protein